MILHKRNTSTTPKVPVQADLKPGELAIDYPSRSLYVGVPDSSPKEAGGIYRPLQGTMHYMDAEGDGVLPSSAFGLNLRLSNEARNELQIRPTGVGYWESAPANLANIYVSPQGNDNNSGSISSPMKTFQAALLRIADGPGHYGNHYIWLKSGASFSINRKIELGQRAIWIYVYDEPKYGTSISGNQCPNYLPSVAADFQRATLTFEWYEHPDLHMAFRSEIHARGIYFNSTHIRYIPNNLAIPEYEADWVPAACTDIVSYQGCNIYKMHRNTILGGLAGSRMSTVAVNIVDSAGGFMTAATAVWFNWDPPVVTCPGMPTYELSPKNVFSYVNYTNISSWTTFDLQHRKSYGITQNWNVFP